MSKFDLTDDERSCVEDALKMLVNHFHEDNCSLEATRARHMLGVFQRPGAEAAEAAAMAARLVQALGFEGAKERVSERLYGPSGLAPRPYWAAVGKAIDAPPAASHAAQRADALRNISRE